jgi:hypothetical protein
VSHLGEDADAFFQKGDEGTYDGGPRSLRPSTRDSVSDDDLTTAVTPELLERRSRLQRLVTRFVGGLGVSVAVLLLVRLQLSAHSSDAVSQPAVQGPAVSLPLQLPVAPAAVVAADPAPPLPALNVPAASEATPVTRLAAPRAHGIASKHASIPDGLVPVPNKSNRAPARAVAAHPTRATALSHHDVTHPVAPSGNAYPLRTTGSHRAPAAHAPPTATFPD